MIQNKTYMEKVTDETLDILFPTMRNKNKINKLKNLPLGKSVFEEDDDLTNIKSVGKIKGSQLDALDEIKDNPKHTSQKLSKERTPEENEEFLNEFYPSMKHLGKDKVNQIPEISDKIEKKQTNNVKENNSTKNKNVKSEEEKNRDVIKILGMDENEYQVKGNTISRKEKPKDYEIINGIKYPKNTDNDKVEKLKQQAKEDRSEKLRKDNTEYLKKHAKLEQFGLDHVDNNYVRNFDKLISGTDEAVENLHMSKTDSYLNTDYAKKHKVLNNYKEEPEYLHEYYKKKIPSQGGDAEKMQGVLIDEKSKSSQNLKESLLKDSVFMEKLKKYSNAMHKGYAINDSMDFEDKNWHNAIGKSDIVNMHINKKGDIELDIVDVNNYNEGESNKMVKIGKDRQDKGEIKPYFIRYHVIIPKDSKIDTSSQK